MANAVGGARGCGSGRGKGDVYWELGTSKAGREVEAFLVCPPVPLPAELISPDAKLGVKLIPRRYPDGSESGTWDVWDGIGSVHYPYPADFVEEVRRKGVSRKLPKNLRFDLLDEKSRLVCWHDRAYVENWRSYGPFPCRHIPAIKRHHPDVRGECCCGFWWLDFSPDEYRHEGSSGAGTRQIVTGSYPVLQRPAAVQQPAYVPAIFGCFPASRLAAVRGGDGRGYQAATRARLPVAEVDE